jgi:DNA replication protein DnaC
LVLDDLGKEKPSEWAEEKLYEIVNARYVRSLPIIITTNVGLKAVEARYPWNGEAIVSRLFEMCRGAQLGGEDYRRRK